MTTIRLGACLSLTGRYARFGTQAAHGLRAWQALAGREVELRLEDDRSEPRRVGVVLPWLATRCDLVIGPYSTQLMRAAGPVTGDLNRLVWNHGGAGDDVQALWPGRVASVLAPASRYAGPFVRMLGRRWPEATLWVVHGPGRFARQVAAGAMHEAERSGLAAAQIDVRERGWLERARSAWDLFSVGTFEDDVAIVRSATGASRPPRTVCSVAAGVQEFARLVEADGIHAVAQWFPGQTERPNLGPTEHDFLAQYRRQAGSPPDYPAVQAAAAAALAVRCADLAGTVAADQMWLAATQLDVSTLFGRFCIDPATGAQVGHAPVLLRWRAGELQPVRP